jgi:hypothetical protein
MTATRKTLLLATLGVGLSAAALTLLALAQPGRSGDNTAHAEGPIIIAIDMDPFNTPTNTCPGDHVHDCTIGTIERCVSVPAVAGTTFAMDALVLGLSNGHSSWIWHLAFPDTASPANLTMTAWAETAPLVNLIEQSLGSVPVSTSEVVPDALSPHTASAGDLSSSETTPPWTQGVESRMTFQVGAGATPGLYGFSFVPGTYDVADENGVVYSTTTGITVLDSTVGCGLLAVGIPCPQGPCPAPTPVPAGGVAELPDVASDSGWSTGAYAGLAGGLAAAFVALSAGAWYAKRRWAR